MSTAIGAVALAVSLYRWAREKRCFYLRAHRWVIGDREAGTIWFVAKGPKYCRRCKTPW